MAQPPPLDFREQLSLTGDLVQRLVPLSPPRLRKCFIELGQAIKGWLALPQTAAVQAMGPALQGMRPTLRALSVSSHCTRLCGTLASEPHEAAKQLYRLVTLLQTVALRPRTKFTAPSLFIWIDDKVGSNTADIEYMTSKGSKPLQSTTTQKACELARQVGDENLGFITNSYRKDDGKEKTVQNLLAAIRAEEWGRTPVLVYMGTDPAPFYLPLQVKEPYLLATMDAAVLRYYADSTFPLYDAEKLIEVIDGVMLHGGSKPRPSQLVLTTLRIILLDSPPFTTSAPWALLMEIPLGVIYKFEENFEKESGRAHVKLHCRDFRTVSFTLPRKSVKFSKQIPAYNVDGSLNACLASQHEVESEDLNSYQASGWYVHSQGWDFERMGCTMSALWVLHAQSDFDICPNYPEHIVLPVGLNNADLAALRKSRYQGAIPVMSYYHAKNSAVLLRAASEASEIELTRYTDTSALDKFINLLGGRAVTIVEVGSNRSTGSRVSASAAAVARQFLDIGTTQDISNVLRKLLLLRKSLLTSDWLDTLAQVGYLELLQRFLSAAQSLAALIIGGTHVIVQSEDGGDMSALVVSLVELLLDPYYRTTTGFAFIVEREWLLHGSSIGWKRKRSKWNDELKLCAPFVVFIDCVWQMWSHDPTIFQFNEEYLLYLLSNLYSGRFGSFIVSSEYERQKHKLPRRTYSIWQEISCISSMFDNPIFDSRAENTAVLSARFCPSLWHAYYLRHSENLFMFDTMNRLKLMAKPEESTSPALKIENLTYLAEDAVELVPFSPVTLNLSGNYLAHLPITLARQTQVKRLLLSKNRFTVLQQGVMFHIGHALQNVVELDLSDNDLRFLPLDGMKSLRTLRLAGNRLSELPSTVSKMTELALLNVSRNNLMGLPERLPISLTIIEAESNSITDMPTDFPQKTNLQVLRLSSNEVAYFPPETFQALTRLRILTLAHTNLGNQARQQRGLPPEERKISALARQMTRGIPKPLKATPAPTTTAPAQPSAPVVVDVELCLPSSLPFSPLAELDLSHLALPFVPSRAFLLGHLVELYLHHNKLTALSTEISKLDRLRVLDLQANSLSYIPLEISACSALECLQLSHNQLRELTPVIGKLQNLTMLDISSNPLRELPASIGQLTRLKQLLIEGLDLENVPKEIAAAGDSAAVRAYLQDIAKGSEPLWRVKLMVAGQENVGKTSLLRGLTRKKATKHDVVATDGIQLDTWNVEIAPEDAARYVRGQKGVQPPSKITISTWDFAGQETYYAAHQFFLSDRSIYLLVWNLAKPESEQRLTYWLQAISSRCPRSPIILVGTHLDDKVCSEEYVARTLADVDKRMRPLAPKLRVVRAVSCETVKGMEDLRQEIESLIFSLEKIGDPVPSAYLALERFAFEERKVRQPPVVTYSAWSSIAQAWGVQDHSSIAAATSLLHNLGSICHFSQPQLKDTVILDPQWLVDVTAALFSIKHNFARNGILPISALLQIWRESRFPPSLHSYLVQLLERFELIFRLQVDLAEAQELLVPDLLPEVRPPTFAAHWPHTWHGQQLERSYVPPHPIDVRAQRTVLLGRRYDLSFSPRGLFGRFMVRLLRFTHHIVLWQQGFVVEREGERLFACMGGDQIELYVLVDKRKTALGRNLILQATEILTAMLRTWYNVEFKFFVLCACCLARNKPRGTAVFAIPLPQITEAIVSGHSVIECGYEGTSVRIDQMAPELLFANAPTLDVNELHVGPKIGEGSYAVVHLGTYRGQKVAVKRMRILGSLTAAASPPASPREADRDKDREQIAVFDDFRRELAMLAGLSHPNLLRLVGYITKPLCIVTEYMNAGDLWALARNTEVELPWAGRMLLAFHVASGVAYLHGITPPILHRDLKSPNILLQRDEGSRITAKLADLGLATALTSKTALGRVVDNPVWLAPEVLAGQEYAEAADIYAVAVIMWELAARTDFLHEVPFWAAKEQHVMAGGRSEVPPATPSAMKDAIVKCWDNDPARRPSMASVAQLLISAIPPGTVCSVPPSALPLLPVPVPEAAPAPPSSPVDDDDDRPPQSASRDLLAVTLVSPARKDQLTDWTTPSIRSEPRKDGTLRIGSPQRAVSPTENLRSRTTPSLPTFGMQSTPMPVAAEPPVPRFDSRGRVFEEPRPRPPAP